MAYTIRSKYLKDKLRKLRYTDDNRRYVRELVCLEKAVAEGVWGWSHAVKVHNLRSSYPKEYAALLKELDPESYRELGKEQRKEAKESRKAERWGAAEDRREAREERGWWGQKER